jgi:hypothetical protein
MVRAAVPCSLAGTSQYRATWPAETTAGLSRDWAVSGYSTRAFRRTDCASEGNRHLSRMSRQIFSTVTSCASKGRADVKLQTLHHPIRQVRIFQSGPPTAGFSGQRQECVDGCLKLIDWSLNASAGGSIGCKSEARKLYDSARGTRRHPKPSSQSIRQAAAIDTRSISQTLNSLNNLELQVSRDSSCQTGSWAWTTPGAVAAAAIGPGYHCS